MADKVFIALQNSADAQPLIAAILADNPGAVAHESPGMVKIDSPGRLVVRRASVEARVGRAFDLQEIHLHLISLGGNLDEDDDEFVLAWHAAATRRT
jgi:phenol/toluene 2-monooxygenase (NADH) P2/A2